MALRIDIKGHITDLQAKLARAKSGIRNFASSVKSRLMGVASAFAAAFVVHRIVSGIRSLMNEMDDLGKKSKALGVGVETFQEMTFAAKIAGVSVQALSKGMGAMSSFMLMAANSGKTQLAILNKLGLEYEDLARMKPEEAFRRITKAIDGVASAQERVGISKQIFGRAGVDLLNVARGYDEAVDLIRSKGGIISEEDIQAAEKFNDAMATIWQTIKAGIGKSGLAQLLADFAQGVSDKGFIKTSNRLMYDLLSFGATSDTGEEEIRKRFGGTIKKTDVATAAKAEAEKNAAKTLKESFDEVTNSAKAGAKAASIKIDQFRRIGATSFGNGGMGDMSKADADQTRWLRIVAENTRNINRKTPEVNDGGKY
jgi:hypothetical protein